MLKYVAKGKMRETELAISKGDKLIKRAIVLVVLAIFVSMTYKLPGADGVLTGWFHVGDIVKIVVLLIMMGIVFSARFPLEGIAVYFANRWLKANHHPVGDQTGETSGVNEYVGVSPNAHRLAGEIANMIIIGILWPIVAQIVNVLLFMDVKGIFSWTFIVVMVVFPSLLFYRIYLAYRYWSSGLDITGGEQLEIPCRRCGALNLQSARACVKCGCPLFKD